ncbi:SDR family oxidoreductase [Paenibacillus sp. GP183]|uniref:SDR family oxidoreductase n=1 Tax=Paenibacillus sp. GP183 TaxID=1882751 RepID=UPI00089554BA|nr:SDR family oxidoreductase [Paenibacillus sp. GP183]SEB80026.1 NAD(P)-dependent dehydrogenase, short-chain alcohol dehydrogenase family [Paenibacillus sp. GP183]
MEYPYPVYPFIGYQTKIVQEPIAFPPQHQDQVPGLEYLMTPRPIFDYPGYVGSAKLKGKVAIITGGDSGFGRAIAAAYAKEGADLAIVYLNEHIDAAETKNYVEQFGTRCLLMARDLRDPASSPDIVADTLRHFNRLDILINNAAVQPFTGSIMDISNEQLENTFRTNIFPLFYLTKAALPYLDKGSAIINTTSRVAYEGDKNVIDYSATKGAIVSFTRSMALSLAEKSIRVNAVAPGPSWTPLNVSTYSKEHVATLGTDIPFGRAAQPFEVAPAFVYLAAKESMYVTGQVIHVNGGKIRYS